LACTLLGCWGSGHTDAWLVITDLAPVAADACWYGLRAWVEQGVKRLKSGGWQWQTTRMTDPERAGRVGRRGVPGASGGVVGGGRSRSSSACGDVADGARCGPAAGEALAGAGHLSGGLEPNSGGAVASGSAALWIRSSRSVANFARDGRRSVPNSERKNSTAVRR